MEGRGISEAGGAEEEEEEVKIKWGEMLVGWKRRAVCDGDAFLYEIFLCLTFSCSLVGKFLFQQHTTNFFGIEQF